MLRSFYQPRGGQGELCCATPPHGFVPPPKRSRVPGHLVQKGASGYSNYCVFYLTT
jgi:hypothetical protein